MDSVMVVQRHLPKDWKVEPFPRAAVRAYTLTHAREGGAVFANNGVRYTSIKTSLTVQFLHDLMELKAHSIKLDDLRALLATQLSVTGQTELTDRVAKVLDLLSPEAQNGTV